jgi:Flp pilus assembly protein TadD
MRHLAAAVLMAALALSPKAAHGQTGAHSFSRGNARCAQGRYDLAVADYTEAIRLDPAFVNAYYNRATAKAAQGRYDLAVVDYTEAIRLDPTFAKAYCNRGVARRHLGQYDLAVADYTEAIRRDPTDSLAYLDRGAARAAQGRHDLAVADSTEAIRLNPTDAEAYCNRGCDRAVLGRYDVAIADFTEAIRLDPTDADAYAYLARIRATCPNAKYRDSKLGVNLATRACDLEGWKNPNTLRMLAAICVEAGDLAAAIKYQEKVPGLCTSAKDREEETARLERYRAMVPSR